MAASMRSRSIQRDPQLLFKRKPHPTQRANRSNSRQHVVVHAHISLKDDSFTPNDEPQTKAQEQAEGNTRGDRQPQGESVMVVAPMPVEEQKGEVARKSIALRRPRNDNRLPQFDKISLLPAEIYMRIMDYVIDNFRLYLSVNPSWYCAAVTAFDNHCNDLENRFVSTYAEYMLFKDSYTTSARIRFCGTGGIRIDRVIKCENLPTTLGCTVTFGYTYRYCHEPGVVFKAEFAFDSVRKAASCVWIHKNECQASVHANVIVP